MENENIITLLDENDNEIDFEVIATLKINTTDYALLAPLDESGDEAIIFKIIEENGEYTLECVDNDDEFNMVANAYEELMDEA